MYKITKLQAGRNFFAQITNRGENDKTGEMYKLAKKNAEVLEAKILRNKIMILKSDH